MFYIYVGLQSPDWRFSSLYSMQIYELFSGLKGKLPVTLFGVNKASHGNAHEGQSHTAHMCECIHADWYTSCFATIGCFSMCISEVCTINTACNNLMMMGKWFTNKLWLDRQQLLMTLPLWQVWKQDGQVGLLAVMRSAELLVKTLEWCESWNINLKFLWIQPKAMLLTLHFIFIFNRPNCSLQCFS